MPARPPSIRDLPFKHGATPHLGLEIFKLSELYDRASRAQLGHELDAPQRPGFDTVYVGLRGKGQLVVDFAPVPGVGDTRRRPTPSPRAARTCDLDGPRPH